MQQTIATLRASEIAATQKTQQLTLILAGAFGTIGLGVILLMAYAQWRTVTRLVELSSLPMRAPALGNGRPLPMLESDAKHASPARAAVELSNARLLGVVERLEKRILELEHTACAPLKATTATAINGQNGTPAASNDSDERIANLLAEGQSLAGANKPEKALGCFDEALGLQPKHAEALVKKGDVLEKLGRLDEAIACYDRALETNDGMTTRLSPQGAPVQPHGALRRSIAVLRTGVARAGEKNAGGKGRRVTSVEFPPAALSRLHHRNDFCSPSSRSSDHSVARHATSEPKFL